MRGQPQKLVGSCVSFNKRRLPGAGSAFQTPLSQQLRENFVRKHPTTRGQAETIWHQLDQTRIVEMSNLTAILFAQIETKPGSKLMQWNAVGESQTKKEGFFLMLSNTQVAVIVNRVTVLVNPFDIAPDTPLITPASVGKVRIGSAPKPDERLIGPVFQIVS